MKLAIVTGASAGIGAAVAADFVQQGFEVHCLSRRPCPVDGVTSHACDLSNVAQTSTVATELQPQVRAATSVCLVHNAARMEKDAATHFQDRGLAGSLEINVMAPSVINRALLPSMPAGSSVILIGSTLAEKAVAESYSYVVSKHAQVGMMRALCQDTQGMGIHTACVCPGFTDTEMLRTHLGQDEELLAELGGANAFGRLVDPGEIARMVTWIHANPVVNGSVIHANLGQKET